MAEPIHFEWHEFIEKFQPMQNQVNDNAPFDGTMYETFGEELEYIKNYQLPECIWTILDCDGALIVSNGFHFVNRFGYIITQVPAESGLDYTIYDEEDMQERMAEHYEDALCPGCGEEIPYEAVEGHDCDQCGYRFSVYDDCYIPWLQSIDYICVSLRNGQIEQARKIQRAEGYSGEALLSKFVELESSDYPVIAGHLAKLI